MPTGWRPDDVAEKFPVYKIEDVYNFEKYAPTYSNELLTWSWIQLAILLLTTSYLFANIATIGSPGIFVYGLFIFLTVYAYSELMDRIRYALLWEIIKNILGCYIIYKTGDWFSSSPFVTWMNYAIIAWFILSTLVTSWFVLIEFKSEEHSSMATE